MTTIDRPALTSLSTNTLNRLHPNSLTKQSLPRLKTVTPHVSIFKPSSPKELSEHAERLKYRLKLAYYKLRTDQVSLPIAEIIKRQSTTVPSSSTTSTSSISKRKTSQSSQPKRTGKKPNVTPSLTRHISLLAASTPLHPSSNSETTNLPKKKVTFNRSKSYLEPSIIKKSSPAALTRINEYNNSSSSNFPKPQLPPLSSYQPYRSLRIDDLVHTNMLNRNITNYHNDDDANDDGTDKDATIELTPIKGRRLDDNGDLIMSSPTKKLNLSTPGSYGAAKSLLQLSLISSN